ncbi:MAG TPA: DinB family protein [Vicinamibacterales bacterium]|nr:DinB family protein [Vicinamibacterales bacterium]
MNYVSAQTWRRRITVSVAAVMATAALSTPARAQEVISKEAAAVLKASFLADLDVMRGKFLGLAEAFPQDKYSWRPMDGVRSVSEVLVLAASEGYAFVPTSFGGKAGASREEMAALRTTTDKAKVIEALNKGFAHAKAELEALDPAQMTGRRQVMGKSASAVDAALAIGGDLHEHLGQMIAYARMNKIVPPWSK